MDEDKLGGERPISLAPFPTEQWTKLPDRERSLQCIGDVIAYWIRWVTREYEEEGRTVTPDTYLMFGFDENAPPHWPSVGQLTKWLEAIRAIPQSLEPIGVEE